MITPSDNLLKDLFSFYLVLIVITTITMVLFSVIPASAEMNLLDDHELSQIAATGFSKFTLLHDANDLARVELNLSAITYTQIETMKLGYWDNGAGTGWDQNWQNASLGTQAQDLVLRDFIFEAEFTDISDPINRQLLGVTVGFKDVTGTISTDFSAFSGSIKGVAHDRSILGLTTVTLANEPFLLQLKLGTGVTFQIGW